MDSRDVELLEKKLARIVRRGALSGKRVVLFGASAATLEIRKALLKYGLRPQMVVDNDRRKIGRDCLGLTVQKPEEALEPHDPSLAILFHSCAYYREMLLQMEKLGYTAGRQAFYLNQKSDESLPVVGRYLGCVFSGFLSYRRLARKYPGHTFLMAPYTGTGDVYLAGLFFREYLKRHKIEKYVFVTVSGACRKVAEMFGVEKVEIISRTAADYIIKCDRALRANWPLLILNDSWAEEHTNLLQWLRGYKDLSFDKMFRYFVFDFKDDVPYDTPPLGQHSDKVDEIFTRHGLRKGRTIVLSPYSNTLFDVPDTVWQRVVEYGQAHGFTVCTNSAGKNEPAVAGTEPVFFPLGLAREFMDAAGWFVGVRSGLCDVISRSSCKKIVLYEKDGFFYQCSPFDYFSLKKMKLCDDAVEIEFRSDLQEAVIRQILAQLG